MLDRIAGRLDHIPRSQVAEVVEALLYEQWLVEVRKNPRIMTLARMKVGDRVDWWHTDARGYMQSADKRRARAVMGEPDADWRLYTDPRLPKGMYRAQRIA